MNSLSSFSSLLSQHVHWDIALLQEVFKIPFQNPGLEDSLGSLVSSQSSDDSCVVHGHSTAGEVEVEAAHNTGYQLFCNSGHYSAVVALNRNLAARVVWHDTCDFASAVVLGCSTDIIVISAYLPNPGLGLDLYLQAPAATNDLIKSAPRDFKYMFRGSGGNCKLFNHCELDHVVGPLIYPGQSVRSGDRERSEAFIALALEHRLRAANTFRPAPRPAPSDAVQLGNTEELSDTWTHFLYPNPRVRSQIDWILCSQTLETSAKVVYSIDCDSDHKLFHLSLPQSPLDIVNASSSSRPQKGRRAKSRKGWQPINEEAATSFTLAMHDLPPDPCLHDSEASHEGCVSYFLHKCF